VPNLVVILIEDFIFLNSLKILSRIYEKVSILSLDVVAGAVCCCAMFARQLQTPVSWAQYFVLGSSVWLIYTIDHLLDALRKPILISPRHRFHRHYRKLLLTVSVPLWIVTAGVAFSVLPLPVVWFGLSLGGCLTGYLVVTHFLPIRYFFKEGWVALLYTAGVWGNVAVLAPAIRPTDWFTVVVFGIIILQQAVQLAWYEAEEDTHQQMKSAVSKRGADQTHRWLKALIFEALVATMAGFTFLGDTVTDRCVWFTLIVIAVILLLITYFPACFRRGYTYRLLSDGILMLPLWIVIISP